MDDKVVGEQTKTKEPAEAISCCGFIFLMGVFLTIVSGILIPYMPEHIPNSSYDPVVGLARWTLLCAGAYFILNLVNSLIRNKLFENKEELKLIEMSKITVLNCTFGLTFLIFLSLSVLLSVPLFWIVMGMFYFWIIPYIVVIYFHSMFIFKSNMLKNLINIVTSGYPLILTLISVLGFILDERGPIPSNAHDFGIALEMVTLSVVIVAILFMVAYPITKVIRRHSLS